MMQIDLHDYYPHQPKGSFVEVSEEVAAAMKDFQRAEVAHQVKVFRYKAYYSFDILTPHEQLRLKKPEQPQETFEREATNAMLYRAMARLPAKQRQRLYAHFILGRSIAEIARQENVHHKSVADSINCGLLNLAKFIKKS